MLQIAIKHIQEKIIELLHSQDLTKDYDDIPQVEIPKHESFGDLTTNIAMIISSDYDIGEGIEIAKLMIKDLNLDPLIIEKMKVVNPGFINFYLTKDFLNLVIPEILQVKENYGKNNLGNGRKVLLEFVSVNPTGPLNLVSVRAATFGDSLKNILNFSNYQTDSEFYVNDMGNKIDLLGQSLLYRYVELHNEIKGLEFLEDGYKGSYMIDLAKEYIPIVENWVNIKKDEINHASLFAMKKIQDEQKYSLEKFGVAFDKFVKESEIRKRGLDKLFQELHDFIYEKDGALYFQSSKFFDNEDRVIKTANGEYTYFFPDIAYHKFKFERNYDMLIDIWGPDHHGYINRMKSALECLGYTNKETDDYEKFKVIICQQVNLVNNSSKMINVSKHEGNYITLDDLLKELGKDVLRFFLLQRSPSSHLQFNFEKAKEWSSKNPVYYIQYAHARICQVLKKYKEIENERPNYSLLNTKQEISLIRKLTEFPKVIEICNKKFDPQLLTVYLQKLATCFHSFYETSEILTDDKKLQLVRINLCKATKQVLVNVLTLLGISIPDRM